MKILMSVLCLVALAGCGTISANPVADVANQVKTDPIAQRTILDLQDASYNLDQAVVVGALSATDPAPACIHGLLTELSIDPANPTVAGASFTPKVVGPASFSAVAYIRAQQLQSLQGQGLTVPTSCDALNFKILKDGLKNVIKGFPGGGNLILFK